MTMISPKADVRSKQVFQESCIFWDSCKLHEKTFFKDCLIANYTEVHNFSRIINSIVMNNVLIKEK